METKLVDTFDYGKIGKVGYLQAVLIGYGVDPIGLNRSYLLDAIAMIIVSEIKDVKGRGILENLREINRVETRV